MPRWYFTSPEPLLDAVGVLRALELAEDLTVGLAGDVGEHVEAAAVGHADRDLVEAGLGGALQDLVEQRDERLAALEAEALLADVLGLQERLERLGLVELAEDAQLLVVAGLLRTCARRCSWNQRALRRVLDVHVLDADRAAVRVAQHAEDVAQQHRGACRRSRR